MGYKKQKSHQKYDSESRLDAVVCAWLRTQNYEYLKQGRGSNTAKPDLLILLGGGRHIWIELKARHGQLTAQQRVYFKKLLKKGDKVYVCKTLHCVMANTYHNDTSATQQQK